MDLLMWGWSADRVVGRECEHCARDGHMMWGTLSAAVRSTWGHVSVIPFRGQSCEPYDPLEGA